MEKRHFDIEVPQILRINSVKPSFWLLHTFGWLGYAVIFSVDNILFMNKEYGEFSYKIILPLLASAALAWSLTLPLRYLYRRCWNLAPQQLLLTILVASILAAIVWTPLKNIIVWQFSDGNVISWLQGETEHEYSKAVLFSSVSYSFFMVLVWSSFYFGINYHFRLVRERAAFTGDKVVP